MLRSCPRSTHLLAVLCALVLVPLSGALAQVDPSSRLQQGEQGKNKYRGGQAVSDMQAVKKNMEDLFKPILISGKGDGKADKWYSPHLRDMDFSDNNKTEESAIRKQTSPRDFMITYCLNPFNPPIQAACPITVPYLFVGPDVCQWHGEKFLPHRPVESCFTRNTLIYENFTKTSNWKVCCVDKDQVASTSEQIVSRHPDGDGWAGLFEFYYPVSALGWENDRTTSMIVDQQKIKDCREKSDKLMENAQAQEWVAKAIERNQNALGGSTGGSAGQVQQEVAKIISQVRPQEKENRFTDSLQSEGLTVRPNLASLDPEYRKKAAQRFCMRPNQFDKIMNPAEDPVQLGGGLSLASLDKLPVWSNYCEEGVNLMTKAENSNLKNLDNTPTDFMKGMQAWKKDPLYCQRMHLTNPNMKITGFEDVIRQSSGEPLSEAAVGHTCLDNDKLNGGMVPLTLNRHAAVERRTAIADHAVGFLIAAGLAEGMHEGQKSYYKRFEPQKYSATLGLRRTFIGPKYPGGGTNELIKTNPAFAQCESLGGESYTWQNKADRLYISNKTHEPFTQQMIDDKNNIDKYGQEWADTQQNKIADRGLDEKSQNYASAFRIFALCPSGMTRWRPLPDPHEGYLPANVEMRCQEENFGGQP